MKVLIDTNVIIDALQDRDEFARDAGFVVLQAFEYEGYIAATSVTDIYYIQHRYHHDKEKTKKSLEKILKLYDVVDVTGADCRNALSSNVSDFEDAVMVEAAKRNGMDCIVTRDKKDFKNSSVSVYTPLEFLRALRND